MSKIVQFDVLDAATRSLIREAVEARNFAYSPYSNFKVGAALLTGDDCVYRGCNIENASFTPCICAERTAYAKAISEGKMIFKAIAVVAHQNDSFTTPCGVCRQFMSEFGNVDVFICKPKMEQVLITSLYELLPLHFRVTNEHTFL